jgi:preprotein translocase subunit SecY
MKSELARRIVFTLGALLIFRLGSHIPVPGVDYAGYRAEMGSHGVSFGRALNPPLSIFSLGLVSYLSAAILIQLFSMVSARFAGFATDGEAGRRKTARYTLALATLLAAFQAFGIASALQNMPGLVGNLDGFFVVSTIITLTGGTIFLIWLTEQITAFGIGNGIALILFAGVVVKVPSEIATVFEFVRQGRLSAGDVAWLLALWGGFVALVVFAELAHRRLPVEFAARMPGNRRLPAQSAHLSFKLNQAGVVPIVVAPWLFSLLLIPAVLVLRQISPALAADLQQLQLGYSSQIILATAVVVFAFIYTAFVTDPEQAADSLKKLGGVIPGVEPGESTAAHIDHVVSYTACVGAAYLAAIFLLPTVLASYSQAPFYLAGTSVLIVVCVVLDIKTQVRGQSLTEPGGVFS